MASRGEILGEIEFFKRAGKLKRIGRRGWNLRGIECPENVADHTYRTALLCLYYGKKFGLDYGKLVSLALLHDINEAETGELVTGDKFKRVSERQKLANGLGALKKITASLPKKTAVEYTSLWKEENSRANREASVARDLNKLELAIQALEYELSGHPGERLEDMWEHAKEEIQDKRLKEVLSELEKMRPSKGKMKRA